MVSPLRMVEAGGSVEETARAIVDVAEEYGAGGIVIGLPLNMDGTEGPQARKSRVLAEAVGKQRVAGASFEIHLHDERLSSHAADGRLAERELTRDQKRARQDSVAAQIMLESFIAMKREEGRPADA